MSVSVHQGDCLEVLRSIPTNSICSFVTDPPYGLSFMNKRWDHSVPSVGVWREALRVLKPGGHILCFGGTRTYHRLVVNIEDAGFDIRDQIGWLYGSGFPKSHNLHDEWEGCGTALKPAWEPICMARKPLIGTVAANMLEHRCGAINIKDCRVGTENITQHGRSDSENVAMHGRNYAEPAGRSWTGRWPTNVIHDGSDEVIAAFPAQSSVTGSRLKQNQENEVGDTQWLTNNRKSSDHTVSGSPARFFYCAKASKTDRAGSKHPTVKPIALMRYLVRLVTLPGGTVLDPFAGSGTTGQAAIEEGFDAVLIEREAEYCDDIRRRLAAMDHASA